MESIAVDSLTKRFGDLTAVDSVSFSVAEGELFGLLGPNGAGKTTIINILSTLIRPTLGRAFVNGHDISKDPYKVRDSIGIVFQEPALDNKLTGRENLQFHGMMYGLKGKQLDERIKHVTEVVELTDKSDILVERYSGGMKRRLEIARGLIHQPKVMFLDEPTIGLDAQTRRHIWEYIRKLNSSGTTIILTTHYMEEADALCKRVAIVDRGKIVALSTPADLKDALGGDIITLETKQAVELERLLRKERWTRKAVRSQGMLSITSQQGEKRIPQIMRISQDNGIEIGSVNLRKPSLEDVFLHFTGKDMREDEASQHERNREVMRRRMR